ncbi:hypothetical protein CK203_113694 [Vitis vinifera]|uniref:Uncharacterized protein n=1 Tax=Vitis vinifera TaxID=29760 RepID=A0A438CCC2_VITVI|nr:hypothetical protein CK203_113694 [Vitis vinifera]
MKLNPSKCAFGVNVGKFLGFMVTQRGIEVNPDQIKAVIETFAPSSKKELQRLTGRLATLGRFIARFTDKLRSLFLALKGASTTGWTEDYQSVFEEIKRYLTQPPILSSPQPGEQLYIERAKAHLLHQQSDGRRGNQILENGTNNLSLEMCRTEALPLFPSPSNNRAHQPASQSILHKLDLSGRMLKWAIDLSEYGIKYQPRLSIKSQVMADFIAETPQSSQLAEPCREGWWILHVDGASRASGSEVVEYEAIMSRLCLALAFSASQLEIRSDSQLIVGHIQGEYEAKDRRMAQYLTKV